MTSKVKLAFLSAPIFVPFFIMYHTICLGKASEHVYAFHFDTKLSFYASVFDVWTKTLQLG